MTFLRRALVLFLLSVMAAMGRTFVHPGALNSKAELDLVKTRVQAGAQPWAGEFQRAAQSSYAIRTPHPLSAINSQGADAEVSRDDAIAAYTLALLWYFSSDETYAQRAVALLNAWSGLERFSAGSEQDRLQAGWIGAVFAPAAEIMRGYPGWAPADMARLQAMFRRAFYPQLNQASFWNGNVDLTEIDAILAIAVFNDDDAEFQLGLDRFQTRTRAYFYLRSDGRLPPSITGDHGNIPAFWCNPVQWVDGLMQETCRDNGHHAQFALGSALHAAETAWHQGVDLYTENQARLTAAMELLALQLVTGSMQGVAKNDNATVDRYDTWEIGYNHYHNRKNVALPYTEELIEKQIRTRAPRTDWNLVYETLTHAGVK